MGGHSSDGGKTISYQQTKQMKKTLSFILLSASTCLSAFGWGQEGHQAVGQVAKGLISDSTRAQIVKILGNDDLAAVATWADEVRAAARGQGPLTADSEVKQFNKTFPDNSAWHFVNLPLGAAQYTDGALGSATNDVVHAINNCVAALEGTPSKLTKVQALRLLVHFVGDIHQPLHVGTGYFEIDDVHSPVLITDPAQAVGKPDDMGGNDLFFTASEELHAFWDVTLVKNVAKTADFTALAGVLSQNIDKTKWKDSGDHHAWAKTWAGDSVKQALQAYQPITFGAAEVDTHNRLRKISITKPASYEQDETTIVQTQLAKAGFHLAELLDNINWKN